MKKKLMATITKKFEIEIPDNKLDEILKDFQDVISSSADNDSLFEQIAYNKVMFESGFCEGIGTEKEEYFISELSECIEVEEL